jgi:hypothetical protein
MKIHPEKIAKAYSSNNWTSVFSTLSGLVGVIIGMIIANFIGWI